MAQQVRRLLSEHGPEFKSWAPTKKLWAAKDISKPSAQEEGQG